MLEKNKIVANAMYTWQSMMSSTLMAEGHAKSRSCVPRKHQKTQVTTKHLHINVPICIHITHTNATLTMVHQVDFQHDIIHGYNL